MRKIIYGSSKTHPNREKRESVYEKFEDGSSLCAYGLKPFPAWHNSTVLPIP